MFPEYRDLISRLKNENPRFMSLFDKHNKLDHEIARKEGSDGRGYNAEVVRMKKRLTHHAVVNILTFIRRWREILIQPCFTDSVPLTT